MMLIDRAATNAPKTGFDTKLTIHPSRSNPAAMSNTPEVIANAAVIARGLTSPVKSATSDADNAATAEAGPTTRNEVPPVIA